MISGSLGLLFLLMVLIGLVFLIGQPLSRSGARHIPAGAGRPPPGWQPPREPVLPPVTAADVSSLRNRLGHDVSTLQPGDDPVARQALADAAERYSTASTVLERAGSDAQLRTAWLAAVEGLTAARVARGRLGLDLGPPIPALPGAGPQLTSATELTVEGRAHRGSPTYEPGLPHYFPGGSYGGRPVPGGWYDVPFWPAALVLGGLGGWGLGGLMTGAMYGDDIGGGFDSGFGGDGGGDFGGSGGGGDWGGGFGGSGGGGDFGGDFGGGDW